MSVSMTSAGVVYSASQTVTGASGASVTAQVLDHYEEGTWTPNLESDTADAIDNYDGRNGQYTRIGRLVTAACYIDGGTKGTISGTVMRVSGLPFVPDSTVSYQSTAIGYWHNFGIGSEQVYASVYAGNSFAYLFKSGTNVASTQVTPSDVSNQCSISLTAPYHTT